MEDVSTTTSNNKRVKIMSSPSLEGFADEVLSKISGYLRSNSSALLAVALTASSSSWQRTNWKIEPTHAAKVVLSTGYYHYICFGDDDKELAAQLTDADIGGFLACVLACKEESWVRRDGVAKRRDGVAKSIYLVNCKRIIGYGLEPLRNCTQLESIYLGEENDTMLSAKVAIPILESVIRDRERPLHFTLPKKWHDGESVVEYLLYINFLKSYNVLMNSRNVVCCLDEYEDSDSDDDEKTIIQCDNICRGTKERPWVNVNGDCTHNLTCDCCNKTYCNDCSRSFLHKGACVSCKVKGCRQCCETKKCDECHVSSVCDIWDHKTYVPID